MQRAESQRRGDSAIKSVVGSPERNNTGEIHDQVRSNFLKNNLYGYELVHITTKHAVHEQGRTRITVLSGSEGVRKSKKSARTLQNDASRNPLQSLLL